VKLDYLINAGTVGSLTTTDLASGSGAIVINY